MAFGKKSDKHILVYEYGCLPPITGEKELVDAVYRRNALWNKFVEIDRANRLKVRELLPPVEGAEELNKLKQELAEIREEIKRRRKAAQRRNVDLSGLPDKAEAIKQKIQVAREVYQTAKLARKSVYDTHREALNKLEQERMAGIKEAIHQSQLWWCNYEDVFAAYDNARKRTLTKGIDLKFHRFDGTGKVTVRYQQGLPSTKVFSRDTRLQIDQIRPDAWDLPRKDRRRATQTKVRLRIGSRPDRSPFWVELPMVMHRPLPPDSEIRSSSVVRERVGERFRYKLLLTVAVSDRPMLRQGNRTCAIDLGWRVVSLHPHAVKGIVVYGFEIYENPASHQDRFDGVRVAYWSDDKGMTGQLMLPRSVIANFDKIADLRSIRDEKFNHIRADLDAWKRHKTGMPEWFDEEFKTLADWRSPRRLVRAFNKWKDGRFASDEEFFPVLQNWVKREEHLMAWQANLADQVLRHRREIYRRFAAWLTGRYDRVCVEDMNISQIARNPTAEQTGANIKAARRMRFIAAPSSLRLVLEQTSSRKGVTLDKVQSAYSTQECHKCGHIEPFDAASQLIRVCPACNAVWDQDRNASANLLARV